MATMKVVNKKGLAHIREYLEVNSRLHVTGAVVAIFAGEVEREILNFGRAYMYISEYASITGHNLGHALPDNCISEIEIEGD